MKLKLLLYGFIGLWIIIVVAVGIISIWLWSFNEMSTNHVVRIGFSCFMSIFPAFGMIALMAYWEATL